MDYIKLGLRIREVRLSKNITQQKLSEMIGVSPNYVSSIERATGAVSLETLVNLSNALDASILFLLQDSLSENVASSDIDKKLSIVLQAMSLKQKEYIFENIGQFKIFCREYASELLG